MVCQECGEARAVVKRSKTGDRVCKACFYRVFEEEVHATIVRERMFQRGEVVCVAASGGKDSTVLAEVMTTLNARHDYGLDLRLYTYLPTYIHIYIPTYAYIHTYIGDDDAERTARLRP